MVAPMRSRSHFQARSVAEPEVGVELQSALGCYKYPFHKPPAKLPREPVVCTIRAWQQGADDGTTGPLARTSWLSDLVSRAMAVLAALKAMSTG